VVSFFVSFFRFVFFASLGCLFMGVMYCYDVMFAVACRDGFDI
jgi:hypothetical protein